MLRIGAVEQAKYSASLKGGPPLPSLHSAQFAPDREPTLKAAIAAEVIAVRTLLAKPRYQLDDQRPTTNDNERAKA